jgi:hypothetical protein
MHGVCPRPGSHVLFDDGRADQQPYRRITLLPDVIRESDVCLDYILSVAESVELSVCPRQDRYASAEQVLNQNPFTGAVVPKIELCQQDGHGHIEGVSHVQEIEKMAAMTEIGIMHSNYQPTVAQSARRLHDESLAFARKRGF